MNLNDIFSLSRGQILRHLFIDSSREMNVGELEQQSTLSSKAIQDELEKLQTLMIISGRQDGGVIYYRANKQHPLFLHLQRFIIGAAGVEHDTDLDALVENSQTIRIRRNHSIFLKAAILECHGYKCVYTGELLNLRTMTLDHVLHHEMWRTPGKLKIMIEQFGLPPGFNPNGPENLMLASNPANREKSNKLLSEENQRFYIDFVASKLAAVRELEKKLSLIHSRDELIVMMRTLQRDDTVFFDELLNALDDTAIDEETDYISDNSIRFRRKHVEISCNCPHIDRRGDLSVSALVMLNRLTLSQAMITFGPMTLYNELLRGTNLPVIPEGRPWIRGENNDADLVCIDIANVTCFVYRPAAEQLARLCDTLKPELLKRSLAVEKKWGTLNFEPVSLSKFRLLKTPMWMWDLMLAFAAAHDFSKGKSKWHIFNANNSLCVRTTLHATPEIGLTRPCIIWPGTEERLNSILPSHDEVWLCWDHKEYDWNDTKGTARTMNANETAHWIIEHLIPTVVEWHNSVLREEAAKRWTTKFLARLRPIENLALIPEVHQSRGYSPILPLHWLEKDAVERLQQFFNIRSAPVPTKFALATIEALQCLLHLPGVHVSHYVIMKLGDQRGGSPSDALKRQTAMCIALPYVDGGMMDYLFRGMAALFKDNEKRITKEVRAALAISLSEIIHWHDSELYRERLVKMSR